MTDERKKLVADLNANHNFSFENSSTNNTYDLELRYRPVNVIQISFMPQYTINRRVLQYVDTYTAGNKNQYLFAKIDERMLSLPVRLNLSLLPNLSIQYWGQPFLATGNYTEYKKITDPKAPALTERYRIFNQSQLKLDPGLNQYTIDEAGTGTPDYVFENPDFNFKQFRSNLVVKWEYVPGSDLYLVWSQSRDPSDNYSPFSPFDDMGHLFSFKAHNVWLIKLSYRFRL
jgi:hypothetical protein